MRKSPCNLRQIMGVPWFMLLLLLAGPARWVIGNPATVQEPTPIPGANVISLTNRYDDATFAPGQLEKFMDKLVEANIQRISIRVTWATMEWNKGQYSSEIVSNLRRVAEAADARGIKVMLDFHTLFNKDNYTAPKWLADYPQTNGKPGIRSLIMTVRNPEAGQAYLDMQKFVLTQLKDVRAIDMVALINEPWPFWDEGADGARRDMDAISDLLVKAGRQVLQINPDWKRAVRFTLAFQPWSDASNKRYDVDKTFQAADVIGLNNYFGPTSETSNEGSKPWNQGASWNAYSRAVQAVRAAGKEFWVTEFGMTTSGNDDKGVPFTLERQKAYMEAICQRWWEGPDRPDGVLIWVVSPHVKPRQGFCIWDGEKFDWNPAGQVFVKYAKRAGTSSASQ